jgi:hypothetical protein
MSDTPTRMALETGRGTIDLTIERPEVGRTVGRLALGARTFEIIATRDEGLDGEPASWRAEVAETARHDGTAHPLGWDETNVGYASPEEALEETARRLVETIGGPRER